MSYPVHYSVEHPERFTRPQLATQLVAFHAAQVAGEAA